MMMKFKIRSKLIFNNIISVIVIAFILFIAYLNNKLLEIVTTMVLFYIFRFMFIKQYHSFTIYGCAIVSLMVFGFLILVELEFSKSILSIVLFTFLVNLCSYYVKDYLDNKDEIKSYKKKFDKMKNKRLEELSEDELLRLLPDIKASTIHIVYGYIHRDKGITAIDYADRYNISEPLVYKYVKQVKDSYRNLINF